jgi:ribosomal protein S18 acetylase RimI-like enzyme
MKVSISSVRKPMSDKLIAEPMIRPARRADLREIVRLCVEHARYERAAHEPAGLAERLDPALFGRQQRLQAWVVETGPERLQGYATATIDYSTWTGSGYLHLDCLYLEEALRGRGWGVRLLATVFASAHAAGLSEVQWQTPSWNAAAIRFYERQGASGGAKVRFTAPTSLLPLHMD